MVLRQRWFVVLAALVALVLLLLVAVQLGPVRARVLAGVIGRLRTDFGIDLTAARLDYSPFTLSVRLEQARLAAVDEGVSRPGPAPFLEVDEIRVDLPWSIAVGRLAIDRIVLSRPRLTIVRDEHGALNLPRASGGGGGLARLPIGAIGVENGNVQYVDRQHGFSIEARGLALSLQPVAGGVSAGPVSIAALRVAAAGRETETTRLEGGMRYDGADVSLEGLQATAPEGDVRIDGRLVSVYASPQADLTYRALLDLARLAPWLSISRAPAGTVTALGRITGALSNPQATMALSGDGLSWAAWRGVSVQGEAAVSFDGATVRSLRLSSADGLATATAAFDFAGSGGSRAHAEWHDVVLARVLDSLEADAPVRLAARLDGKADASWREARLDALELRAENTARPPATPARGALALDGTARLVLGGGAYRLDETHRVGGALEVAGLAEGRVAGGPIGESGLRGTARVTSNDLAAAVRSLDAAGLDLSALERLGLDGRAQAELALSGTLGAPRAEGPVTGTGVRLFGAPPASLSALVTLTPDDVRADGIDLEAGANRVRGRVAASLDRRTLSGEMTADLGALGDALAGVPARWRPDGAATVAARLGGTFAAPRIDATVVATKLDAAGQHADSARAALRLDGATLTVESLDLTQAGGGRLAASGTYGFDDERYTLKLEGTNLAVRPIPGVESGAGDVPLDASVDVRFEGAGDLARPSGKGAVEAHRLAWNGVEAGPGRADVSLDRGVATIDASATDLRATVHGTVSIPAPRRFTLRAEVADLDLARLARVLGAAGAPVTGVLALSGTASGDLDHLDAADAAVDLRRLEATQGTGTIALVEPATVTWRDGVLTAGRIALRAGGTSLTASGRLARGAADGRVDLALDGDLKDLLPFVPAAAGREGLEASGALTLRVTATGSLDRPDVTGDLRVEDGHVAAAGLPAARALGLTAAYRGGVLELSDLRGVWQGAVLTGSGRLPARLLAPWLPAGYLASLPEGDGTARLSGRVDPITRAALEPWFSADTLAQLNVSAAASLTLEADRPALDAIRGALVLDRLALSAARVPITQERPTRLVIAGGRLTVADWAWAGGGTRLSVSGGAGLEDRRLDVTVKGTSDLRVLSVFLPGAATAGAADVDVRVHGPIGDPELDGRIALAGGQLNLRDPRFAATDVSGTITLDRNRVVVGGIGGNANGGLIQIQGELEHEAFALTGGTLSLVGRRIALDVPEGLRTEVDADLTLDVAADAAMTIGGKVTIQRGAYRDPIVLTGRVLELLRSGNYLPPPSGEPSALDQVRLNVAVVTASDLVVDDNYGHMRVGADLRVGGTLGRPALGGRATLREGGQLFLGGNTYQLQQGTIDFVDPNGIKPDLNLTAETRVASYDITLNVSGTPDAFKANLSSADPTLSQGDLVSLLVTGRTLAEAGTLQTGAAGDQALRLLSGDILGFAGRAVGVDTLRLTQGEPTDEFTADPSLVASTTDPATRLTVSKNLSRQVEVILSQSLRQSGGLTWIAVYRPIPSLDIRGVSHDDGSRSYETFQQMSFGGAPRRGRRREGAGTGPPRVADVRITGTPGFDPGEIRGRLDLDAGDRFDFFTWQEDRDRLQRFYEDRGYLEAKVNAARSEADDGRVTLTYDVARGPKTTLVVQGYDLPAAVGDELRERWAGAVYDGFLLEDLRAMVRTSLARDGHLRADVADRIEQRGTGAGAEKTIVLDVTPGPVTATRRIAFHGNARVTADRLHAVLRGQDLDLEAWLDPSKAESVLTAFYRGEGLLDATVRIGAPEFDGGAATLPVVIDEGPLFHVGPVRVDGAHGLSDAAVREAFGVAAGAPYVPARIEDGRQRVELAYSRNGFAAARVVVRSDVTREPAEVALALDVQEGPQRVLAGVSVEGAPGTSRGVVTRAIQAKPGEPVDPGSWYLARKRLYDTGVFRSADIEFTPVGEAATVDGVTRQPVRADVTLQESPPWRLRYGFRIDDQVAPSGTGRDLSPGVLVDLQQRNLFGRAIGGGVTGTWQSDIKLARAFLTLPRLVALPVKTNVFLTRSRQDNPSFVDDRSALSAEQQLQPAEDLKVTYGYRYERDHTFDPNADPTDPLALNYTVNVARLNAAAVIDTRTDPFDPRGGWFHASNFEYAASVLGSDLRFVKYLAQQYYFHEVGPVTLASAARFGAGHGLGQDLIPSERFYAGGGTTVRGYAQDSLGPADFFGPSGGDAMLVLNQEARFPVYRWVRAVGFVDAGNAFSSLSDLSLGGLKVGVGFGLRLDTPFALLRVDFGVPLSREPGTPKGRWYFSFGQIF